jgi:DNA-binding protein YbaB
VTEPGFTPKRVAELQRQADDTMAALRERITAATEVRERAMSVSGEASSHDGTVTAVVDSTGVVTSLTFAPSVFDRNTPEKLASTVVAVIQKAAAKARADMAEAMAPIRSDADAARKAAAGVPDLSALRFDVPAVPQTAVDRSGQQDPWAGGATPEPPSKRSQEPEADEDSVFEERSW